MLKTLACYNDLLYDSDRVVIFNHEIVPQECNVAGKQNTYVRMEIGERRVGSPSVHADFCP